MGLSPEVAMSHVHQIEQTDHETALRRAWEASREAYAHTMRLVNESAESLYGREALYRAVSTAPTEVLCIDERAKAANGRPKIGIAGSGVLWTPEQRQRVAAELKANGVTTVTYHEGCGACVLACQNLDQTDPGHTHEPLAVGQEAAVRLLQAMGESSQPVRVGYSEQATIKMRGHAQFHDPRMIVLDGTGRFNPDALALPPGFFHSVRYTPDTAYIQEELKVALSIAMGDHAFGKDRHRQEPLGVLIVGDAKNKEKSFDALYDGAFRQILDEYRDVATVLRLDAPDYRS